MPKNKTDAGKREIPIVEGVREAFEMERKYQEENGIVSKSRIDGYEDFIFVNRNGEVQHQGTLNKALKRIMRDCNDQVLLENDLESEPTLLPDFSCHVLRHTFATRICEAGVNLKVIQDTLFIGETKSALWTREWSLPFAYCHRAIPFFPSRLFKKSGLVFAKSPMVRMQ